MDTVPTPENAPMVQSDESNPTDTHESINKKLPNGGQETSIV